MLLLIGFGFFVRDIWADFQEGKTNDRVYSERLNYFEHPTITICFSPQVKISKLQQYNKTLSDLSIYGKSVEFPISPQSLSDEISYVIGRDFTVNLILSDHHGFVTFTYKEGKDSGFVKVS